MPRQGCTPLQEAWGPQPTAGAMPAGCTRCSTPGTPQPWAQRAAPAGGAGHVRGCCTAGRPQGALCVQYNCIQGACAMAAGSLCSRAHAQGTQLGWRMRGHSAGGAVHRPDCTQGACAGQGALCTPPGRRVRGAADRGRCVHGTHHAILDAGLGGTAAPSRHGQAGVRMQLQRVEREGRAVQLGRPPGPHGHPRASTRPAELLLRRRKRCSPAPRRRRLLGTRQHRPARGFRVTWLRVQAPSFRGALPVSSRLPCHVLFLCWRHLCAGHFRPLRFKGAASPLGV